MPHSRPGPAGGNGPGNSWQLVAPAGSRDHDGRHDAAVPRSPCPRPRPTPAGRRAGTRAIARRLYAAVADLPIISPHGHVPPQWLAEDTAVHATRRACSSPRTTTSSGSCTPRASRSPTSASAGARSTRRRRGGPGACSPSTGSPSGARRAGSGWTPSSPTSSGHRAAGAGDRRRDLRPDRRGARPAGASDPVRSWAVPHRGPRHDRRPGRRPAAPPRPAADPSFAPRVIADVPARPLPRAGPARLRRTVDALGEAAGVDTGRYAGYIAALEERRRFFKENGAVSSDHSHADVVTLTLDDAEAQRIYDAALRGVVDAGRGHRFPTPHARRDGPDGHRGRPRHDAAPGRPPQPPRRPSTRFGPDTGHDIPVAVEFTRGLQPLLDRFGTARASTSSSSPSTRRSSPARSPRWQASTRASSSACRGGSSTRPRRSAASGGAVTETAGFYRARVSSTTPARSCPSPPATTCRGASTPATSRSSSRSTGSTRTRP